MTTDIYMHNNLLLYREHMQTNSTELRKFKLKNWFMDACSRTKDNAFQMIKHPQVECLPLVLKDLSQKCKSSNKESLLWRKPCGTHKQQYSTRTENWYRGSLRHVPKLGESSNPLLKGKQPEEFHQKPQMGRMNLELFPYISIYYRVHNIWTA